MITHKIINKLQKQIRLLPDLFKMPTKANTRYFLGKIVFISSKINSTQLFVCI